MFKIPVFEDLGPYYEIIMNRIINIEIQTINPSRVAGFCKLAYLIGKIHSARHIVMAEK